VNKQIPSYLKLATDTITQTPAGHQEDWAGLIGVCRAFEQATGWQLEYAAEPLPSAQSNLMWSAPVNPGVGASPGHVRLFSIENRRGGPTPCASLENAGHLADALGILVGELLATRRALGQREAELASGVPLVLHADEESPPLGQRLEAVLRGGAEAIGCHAAGLYLLDAGTSELKLRSAWGLPAKRLIDRARPLRGALADLEALLGHAVVLADDELHGYWKVPEKGFGSCVCVPVSSPTMPLGTLWAFCHEAREFSASQTQIWEIIAGRVAAELEREVLIDAALSARDNSRQFAAAERSQQEQLPRIAPIVDGWEIAAKAHHAAALGGAFYDWFALDDGGLAVVAGQALQSGVDGALTASALRAAARAFESRRKGTNLLLERANSILWSGSAGNACAALFQAALEPNGDSVAFSAAGPLRVLAVRPSGATVVGGGSGPLGRDDTVRLDEVRRKLSPGELLLVYTASGLAEGAEEALAALDKRLAASLKQRLNSSVQDLVDIANEILQAEPALDSSDRLLLAIKRRGR
jgi:sigma-B regulation protein RsbU (phosphoserine phosphatase)